MEKINQTDYEKVKDLIHSESINPPTFAHSVLDGMIDGTVYADSTVPKSILVGSKNGIYYVAGKTDGESFNQHLIQLYRENKSQGLRFTLFSPREEWDVLIKEHLQDEVTQMRRYRFTFNGGTDLCTEDTLPESYSISRINPPHIERSKEFDRNYYEEYWGEVDTFVQKGFGFCLLHNETIVSECTSIFASTEYAEIDIATIPAY